MGRHGIFDIGYEDFGFPGGGLPQDRMDLAGVVGAGAAVAPQDVVTSRKSLAVLLAARPYIPAGTNLSLYKDINPGDNDARLPTLVRRLIIVGCRQDPRVPPVYDDQLQRDVIDFQNLAGLPTAVMYPTVDAKTWYALNQAAYLVGKGEAAPLRQIAGPPQTTVPKGAKQPTDNALNASAASTTVNGGRLPVKTAAGNGDSSSTGSVQKHNEEVNRELSRKTKRDVSSLAGKATTPFRPSGVAFQKEAAKDGKVAVKPLALGGAGILAVIVILILIFKPEWVGL